MPKLAKNKYTTAKGERKINCYMINIPKKLVEQTNLENKEVKIYADNDKIIIEATNLSK